MPELEKEIWANISDEDLKLFGQVMRKITETNVFPFVLTEENYKKIDDFTFAKGDDHLIKVFQQDKKWQYQNLKHPEDKGSLIQFIANRWNTEHFDIARNPAQLFLAAKVSNTYYNHYIKSLKAEHRDRPWERLPSTQRMRRR